MPSLTVASDSFGPSTTRRDPPLPSLQKAQPRRCRLHRHTAFGVPSNTHIALGVKRACEAPGSLEIVELVSLDFG